MKKNLIFLSVLFVMSFCIMSCNDSEEIKSVPQTTSIPYIAEQIIPSSYVYGLGKTSIFKDIPDVVGIAVDSVVGFVGGHGGKTGSDSINVLKSDITGWPDTVAVGGYSLSFEKYNRANFKAVMGTNIVIAGPIPDPGPTDLSGTYKRTSNGVLITLTKVFDGVYVIENPGGAGVPPFPYLFYNHKDANGNDELRFPNQSNPCGGGLQLVSETAPNELTSADYSAQYPPKIVATSPLTLRWKIFEFPEASPTSAHTGAALCQWGLGVRTFEKQ